MQIELNKIKSGWRPRSTPKTTTGECQRQRRPLTAAVEGSDAAKTSSSSCDRSTKRRRRRPPQKNPNAQSHQRRGRRHLGSSLQRRRQTEGATEDAGSTIESEIEWMLSSNGLLSATLKVNLTPFC